ncbi:hypothetical protein MD484_g4946, partial [Candolleomyces efflorescens]
MWVLYQQFLHKSKHLVHDGLTEPAIKNCTVARATKASHNFHIWKIFKLRPIPVHSILQVKVDKFTSPPSPTFTMAEITDPTVAAELKKRRTFRTFSYRGIELDKLLDMNNEDFVELVHARARRRFQRGLKRRPMGLIKKLRKAKKEAPPNEKPAVVKTHLRDMIIVPEMIGSVVGIYNGKVFNSVEIKPEMTGHYLAEFSCSYRPVKHGRPGIGATHSSRFIPLK